MKKILFSATVITCICSLAGCERPADVASRNLSYAADRFEVTRRIVFFNGITDKYLMTIEGLCSLGNYDKARELTVTCKTGPTDYKKHFLWLSDNVSYFIEQLEATEVDPFHHRIVFSPETIVPDIDLQTSGN